VLPGTRHAAGNAAAGGSTGAAVLPPVMRGPTGPARRWPAPRRADDRPVQAAGGLRLLELAAGG